MAKVQKLVTLTFADSIGLWDYDNNAPLINPHRAGASWGTPEQDLPPSLAAGYDVQQGTVGVLSVDDYIRVCADQLPPEAVANPQAFFRSQREALRDQLLKDRPEYSYTIGGGESDQVDKETGAKESLTRCKVSYTDIVALIDVCLRADVKWVVCSGQRRRRAMPWAIALQSQLYPDAPQLTYAATDLSGVVSSWGDLRSRMIAENNRGTQHGYSLASLLCLAADVYTSTLCGESALGAEILGPVAYTDPKTGGRKTRRGDYQRLHRFARLALAVPTLNLCKRLELSPLLDDDKRPVYQPDGWVPAVIWDKEACQCLLGEKRSDKSYFAAVKAAHEEVDGCEYADNADELRRLATPEVVEAYIRLAMGGKIKRDGVISYNDLRQLKAPYLSQYALPVSDVINAILSGDKSRFTPGYLANNAMPIPQVDGSLPLAAATDAATDAAADAAADAS